MPSQIKFGTDGWRGVIAEDFTFDNVRICAQAVADYVKEAGLADRGLVIGYDTRFASEDFAAACAEVIAANGIRAYLSEKAIPTPVTSYSVLLKNAGGGIMITASHNPARWNGFKFRTEQGMSAPAEVVGKLERRIKETSAEVKRIPLDRGLSEGTVEKFDPSPAYLDHILQLVDLDAVRGSGLKVIADSMYGAGAGYFAATLKRSSIKLTEIHGERNPVFPGMQQPEPIARNLGELCTAVKKRGANVGLATDGDADRLGVVDEKGEFLTPLQVFALLTLYLLEVRKQRGAIIKTVPSSSMLYRLGEIFQVPVYETPVGFKYVAPKMLEEDAVIGGEESGGFGYRGHVPERDGILSGLYFLDLMVRTGKSPSELVAYLYSKVGPHYYERVDTEFPAEEREAVTGRLSNSRPSQLAGLIVEKLDTTDGFRFLLEHRYWLLVRFSGTEPIIRIYAEADSPERVEKLLAAARKMAGV